VHIHVKGDQSSFFLLCVTSLEIGVNALRETGPTHVDANLYLAMMETPGFLRRLS
jgi:hypothetical protein